jgi:hypothetical protein
MMSGEEFKVTTYVEISPSVFKYQSQCIDYLEMIFLKILAMQKLPIMLLQQWKQLICTK